MEKATHFINELEDSSEFVSTKTDVDLCRDPKDNFLLNLSIDGKADFLITGDKDLLVLEKIESTQIVTLAEFKRSGLR